VLDYFRRRDLADRVNADDPAAKTQQEPRHPSCRTREAW
jgi:hypothetical protein